MKKIIITLLISLLTYSASAQMFNIELTQNGKTEFKKFNSVMDLFDQYEKGSLDSILSGYDNKIASNGKINFRGIEMMVNMSGNAGGVYSLQLDVPQIDFNHTFSGAGSQEDAFKLMTDYLKANQDDLLKKVLKASVSTTPFDMVAGNPNSLMNSMMDSAFKRAGGRIQGGHSGYLLPVFHQNTMFFQGDEIQTSIISLPIALTWNLTSDKSWAILFDLPISYYDIDGSKAYSGELGLGLRFPILHRESIRWGITPAVRAGAVASIDMASGGVLYSYTLSSDIQIPLGRWTLGMTNMYGRINDYPLEISDFDIQYNIENDVLKNGGRLSYRFTDNWEIGTSYTYTLYTGEELFIDRYHETGVALTRRFTDKHLFTSVSLSGSYSWDSEVYESIKIGIDLLF